MMELDYDKELRSLGYVDSGFSGSRGDYFVISYRPGAKKAHKMHRGRVEIHSCGSMKLFEICTPVGVFKGKNAVESAIKALK
jgi:hypothetical protein